MGGGGLELAKEIRQNKNKYSLWGYLPPQFLASFWEGKTLPIECTDQDQQKQPNNRVFGHDVSGT